jgi:hypothetical protein
VFIGIGVLHKTTNTTTKSKRTNSTKYLNFYQAEKIVFGHSVMEDITKEFDGKTINTDVKHGQEKNSDKTKGLLIENGIEYKIDGKGTKTKIRIKYVS